MPHATMLTAVMSATDVQDLSRPSASSSASLARMIGNLALAGSTAAITDRLPTASATHSPAVGQPRGPSPGNQQGLSAAGPAGQDMQHLQDPTGGSSDQTGLGAGSHTTAFTAAADEGQGAAAGASKACSGSMGGGGLGHGLGVEQGSGFTASQAAADSSAGSPGLGLYQGGMQGTDAANAASSQAMLGNGPASTIPPVAVSNGQVYNGSIYADNPRTAPGGTASTGTPISAIASSGTDRGVSQAGSIAAYRPGEQAVAPGYNGGSRGGLTGSQAVRQDPPQFSGRAGDGVEGSGGAGQADAFAAGAALGWDMTSYPVQVRLSGSTNAKLQSGFCPTAG